MVETGNSEEYTLFLNIYYACFGRGGRSNQIAMTARSCNEKHGNNLGKTFANTLEYDDQKLQVEKIMIWFSGKTGMCYSKVGVQVPTIIFFFIDHFIGN